MVNDAVQRIRAEHGRASVSYLDSAIVPVKPMGEVWDIIARMGCFFINDHTQINASWCHPKFCEKLGVSDKELAENQILAGLFGVRTDSPYVDSIIVAAFELSKQRDIIAGEKWTAYTATCRGHRHDQSILSILTSRAQAPRQHRDSFFSEISLEDARAMDAVFYVHRGNFLVCQPYSANISQAYVIIGEDSAIFKRFQESAGKMKDFYSFGGGTNKQEAHKELWRRCTASNCNSYCVIDDDCVLKEGWESALKSAPTNVS